MKAGLAELYGPSTTPDGPFTAGCAGLEGIGRPTGSSRLAGQVGAGAFSADLPGCHRCAGMEAELPVDREHGVIGARC